MKKIEKILRKMPLVDVKETLNEKLARLFSDAKLEAKAREVFHDRRINSIKFKLPILSPLRLSLVFIVFMATCIFFIIVGFGVNSLVALLFVSDRPIEHAEAMRHPKNMVIVPEDDIFSHEWSNVHSILNE